MPIYLDIGKKEKLIEMWNILATKSEKFLYKPTEVTEKQLDYRNS